MNSHTSCVGRRAFPLNATRGALYQLLAEGGWHREEVILSTLYDVQVERVLYALDQGVKEGIYHQWLFRGEGCWSDELHYSLRRDYETGGIGS